MSTDLTKLQVIACIISIFFFSTLFEKKPSNEDNSKTMWQKKALNTEFRCHAKALTY